MGGGLCRQLFHAVKCEQQNTTQRLIVSRQKSSGNDTFHMLIYHCSFVLIIFLVMQIQVLSTLKEVASKG